MTRNVTAVCRVFSFLILLSPLFGTAIAAQASEIRVATGPWPDSIPSVQLDESSSSPPFTFVPIDLTVVEETLTVEVLDDRQINIIGEARNDEDEVAWLSRLEVAGLDADGELVNSATASILGRASVTPRGLPSEWLESGETGWFWASLWTTADRPVETVLIRAQGMIQNLKTETAASLVTGAGLEMVGDWQVGQDGWLVTMTGVVRNTGPEDVVGLRVATVFRDPTGAMFEYGWQGVRAEVIGGFLGGVPSGEEVPVVLHFRIEPEILATATIETRLSAFHIGDPEHRYAILGIGHLQGLGGSTWRSSIDLVNRSGVAAQVILIYRYNHEETHVFIDMEDGEAFHSSDVALELFDVEGPSSGYVLVRSPAPLQISGRTSNESQIGGYGQALPVVTPDMTYGFKLNEGLAGVLSGLKGGTDFRTNIGLVNLGTESCFADVVVLDTAGQVVENLNRLMLPPTAWLQWNQTIPSDVEAAYTTVEPQPGCPIWAYASVIEEGTNDPVTISLQRTVEIDLRSGTHGLRPAIPWGL